jgi:hypothetical protein
MSYATGAPCVSGQLQPILLFLNQSKANVMNIKRGSNMKALSELNFYLDGVKQQ